MKTNNALLIRLLYLVIIFLFFCKRSMLKIGMGTPLQKKCPYHLYFRR